MQLIHQLAINFFIFIIGLFGICLNYKNILIVLIGIELLLLSLNLNFIIFSIYLNDMLGQVFSLFILTIAAAESAIGLAIIILYYRIKGNINILQKNILIKK